MKKTLIVVSLFNLIVGALLCTFILKDMQVSVPEAAVGAVWLLSMNALAVATARAVKKASGGKSAAPSLSLLRSHTATAPDSRKPAA